MFDRYNGITTPSPKVALNRSVLINFKGKTFPGKVVAFNRSGGVEATANGKRYFGLVDNQGKELGHVVQI